MERVTRQEQKARTKARLIEKAEQLFAQKGIANTTTADIAKAIKVSHGTVFIHFATRDELVEAVIDGFGRRLSTELNSKLNHSKLRDLLLGHLLVLADFEDFYLRLISESQFLSPKIRSLVYSMNSALSYKFFEAAKSNMKNHEIKKIDQATFFATWMALLHHNIMNRDLFSEKMPITKHKSDAILNHFLLLIKT